MEMQNRKQATMIGTGLVMVSISGSKIQKELWIMQSKVPMENNTTKSGLKRPLLWER
jgi:hypothetical protein